MAGRTLVAVSAMALLSAAALGCARAQARTTPVLPPLEMPVPPPRTVEPTLVATPQAGPPLVDAPKPTPPGALLANTPPQRPEPARPEPPKPAAAPEAGAVEAQRPPQPATTLQTIPPQKEGEVEQAIRAQVRRATADLSRVQFQFLSPDRKVNYEEAKLYIRQAEEALLEKNLLFARTVADKAATLAAQLAN
jgi:hypothetical protein